MIRTAQRSEPGSSWPIEVPCGLPGKRENQHGYIKKIRLCGVYCGQKKSCHLKLKIPQLSADSRSKKCQFISGSSIQYEQSIPARCSYSPRDTEHLGLLRYSVRKRYDDALENCTARGSPGSLWLGSVSDRKTIRKTLAHPDFPSVEYSSLLLK